jgi:hypothetical protein
MNVPVMFPTTQYGQMQHSAQGGVSVGAQMGFEGQLREGFHMSHSQQPSSIMQMQPLHGFSQGGGMGHTQGHGHGHGHGQHMGGDQLAGGRGQMQGLLHQQVGHMGQQSYSLLQGPHGRGHGPGGSAHLGKRLALFFLIYNPL